MYAVPWRDVRVPGCSTLDPSRDHNPSCKKPSPRPVAREGFMAAPVCRREQTDIVVNRRLDRQHVRLDRTLDSMSSSCRVFRRGGARLARGADPASEHPGHRGPIRETARGADAQADQSIGDPSRLIRAIPLGERLHRWSSVAQRVNFPFVLRASVRRHRRAQGGSPMLRSIRPTRARRPSDASVDPTRAAPKRRESSVFGCPPVGSREEPTLLVGRDRLNDRRAT
jgi:hypothetical protein